MKKLSNPQEQIYDYIVTHCQEHTYPPTVREICSAVGLSSTSTVHMHLNKLAGQSLIIICFTHLTLEMKIFIQKII